MTCFTYILFFFTSFPYLFLTACSLAFFSYFIPKKDDQTNQIRLEILEYDREMNETIDHIKLAIQKHDHIGLMRSHLQLMKLQTNDSKLIASKEVELLNQLKNVLVTIHRAALGRIATNEESSTLIQNISTLDNFTDKFVPLFQKAQEHYQQTGAQKLEKNKQIVKIDKEKNQLLRLAVCFQIIGLAFEFGSNFLLNFLI